jgi:hypothetical protein
MMNSRLFSAKLLATAAMMLTAMAANADIRIFTDQAAFNAAVTAPGVDTYNDLSVQLYPSPLLRTAGAYSYNVSSVDGMYGAGTAADHWLSNNTATDPMVFAGFTGGVSAFGGNFFGSDITGAFVPNASFTLTAADGTSVSYTLNNATTTTFLGFVADAALTSVTLTSLGQYWPTANNLTLAMAAPVPEPETYAMLLGGVALLGFARRRRS